MTPETKVLLDFDVDEVVVQAALRQKAQARRPFPRLSLRRFAGWPEGLAAFVGVPWRRKAA